jgi:hypothetical protein
MELRRTHGVMATALAIAAFAVVALMPARAEAVPLTVTGEKTEMKVPFSLLQQLGPDNISIQVIAPATLTFPNFFPLATFPITGGVVDPDTNMLGTVNHAGGQQIVKFDETRTFITHSLDVTNLRIVNGNQLWGDTADLLPGPAADLTNTSYTYDPEAGQIIYEAEAHLNDVAALILNIYFETDVFVGGLLLGTLKSTINVQPLTDPNPMGYPRPRAAANTSLPLVPAQTPCASPNRVHASPLAYGSCNPPSLRSSFLTTGTPDANGQQAQFIGSFRQVVMAGNTSTPLTDEADVHLFADLTDVRNAGTLTDYEGQLQARATVRITDRSNGDPANEAGTGPLFNFNVPVSCLATPSETIGSACSVATTADTITPGAVTEGKRAIWEMEQVRVFDGGSTGTAGAGDATVFAVQGVFVP